MAGNPDVDINAIKNSKLNSFLYAEVGPECNGSSLTILSMLARLGEDPWTLAARWARTSKVEAVDLLAASMRRMPLTPQALEDARSTASRLIVLLPGQSDGVASSSSSSLKAGIAPEWLRTIFLFSGLLIWMALTTLIFPAHQHPIPVAASQSVQTR